MEQAVDSSAAPQTVEAIAENREDESVAAAAHNESDHPISAPEHQPEGEQEVMNPEEGEHEEPGPEEGEHEDPGPEEGEHEDPSPEEGEHEDPSPEEGEHEDPSPEERAHEHLKPEEDAQEKTAESRLEGLLAAVQQDRSNFEAWEDLLKGAEVAEDVALIRKVFQDFLSVYPLCFGYWKKYAEAEAKAGFVDKAFEVYEQGVGGVPYECNLWTAYADFYEKHRPDDPSTLRTILKRAISITGEGYHSGEVWNKLIALEEKRGSKLDLADVYRRAIRIPLPNHSTLVQRFKQLISENELAAIVPLDQVELLEGSSEVEKKVSYMALVDDSCKMSERENQRRKGFEMNIRRPYFHTKALDEAQLSNWHNYLTFEEREGDNDRIKVLYERCLIPCAQYGTYWIRFARFCEREEGKDKAQEILGRALTIFLPSNKDLLACYARLAERTGEIEGSRTAYQNLLEHMCPGSLNATVLFANFERRAGNVEKAKEAFETALKYSIGDIQGAREILERAMREEKGSISVIDAIISFELSQAGSEKASSLAKIYKEVLSDASGLGEHHKRELAKQFSEHMDMYGNSDAIEEADGFYWKFSPIDSCYLEDKASQSGYEGEASNPAKRLKTADAASAQSSVPLSSGTRANVSASQAMSVNRSASSAAANGTMNSGSVPYNYSQYGQAYPNQYAYGYGAYGQAYQGNYAYGSGGQYPQNGQYNYYGYYQ